MRHYKSPEVWKAVPGFDGKIFASSHGNVKRVFLNGKVTIKKQKINRGGYAYVDIKKNGVHKYLLVHRLVAEAFLIKASENLEVNHKDHNKLNNNVKNLEWVTHKQNMLLLKLFREYGYRRQIDKKRF